MKRRRKPTFNRTRTGNIDERIQVSGPSIVDLPITIFVDVLLKLDTKSIVSCKCVCNSWRNLISDPQFAKFHLAQAKTVLLIRYLCYQRISRTLYLLEPEDGCSFSGYCWCGSFQKKCKRCHLGSTLEAKLKLPLRNAQVMFDLAGDDTNVIFHTENNNSNRSKRKCSIKLESGGDHRDQVENSCIGLLCLTDGLGCDNVVVCNPILGEFIYLPKSSRDGYYNSCFRVGLGFSPKNNQYKVFRVFSRLTTDPATGWLWRGTNMAEIHTLGTVSWRSADIAALKLHFDRGPIYLNRALHLIGWDDHNGSHCIVYF